MEKNSYLLKIKNNENNEITIFLGLKDNTIFTIDKNYPILNQKKVSTKIIKNLNSILSNNILFDKNPILIRNIISDLNIILRGVLIRNNASANYFKIHTERGEAKYKILNFENIIPLKLDENKNLNFNNFKILLSNKDEILIKQFLIDYLPINTKKNDLNPKIEKYNDYYKSNKTLMFEDEFETYESYINQLKKDSNLKNDNIKELEEKFKNSEKYVVVLSKTFFIEKKKNLFYKIYKDKIINQIENKISRYFYFYNNNSYYQFEKKTRSLFEKSSHNNNIHPNAIKNHLLNVLLDILNFEEFRIFGFKNEEDSFYYKAYGINKKNEIYCIENISIIKAIIKYINDNLFIVDLNEESKNKKKFKVSTEIRKLLQNKYFYAIEYEFNSDNSKNNNIEKIPMYFQYDEINNKMSVKRVANKKNIKNEENIYYSGELEERGSNLYINFTLVDPKTGEELEEKVLMILNKPKFKEKKDINKTINYITGVITAITTKNEKQMPICRATLLCTAKKGFEKNLEEEYSDDIIKIVNKNNDDIKDYLKYIDFKPNINYFVSNIT